MAAEDIWVPALIELIRSAPAIAQAIELSKLPAVPDAYLVQLKAAKDAAVAQLDADVAAMEKQS
jgi:hypothetical protein